MDLITKLLEIVSIQNLHGNSKVGNFEKPINQAQTDQIEKLIGEPLPQNFLTLYSFANGQVANSSGLLFGTYFMSATEIVSALEISLTFVKPKDKKIINKEKSDSLLQQIVDFHITHSIKRNVFGFKKKWHKIEFKCGLGAYGGPYVYADASTSANERETIKIESKNYDILANVVDELHALEKEHYHWDELEFVVFANGEYKVERTFFDFDKQITFTSTPENAIRKKYFHYKWLPVFTDGGGNYIGIDLDPDTQGQKGQIILFGRDESNMVVFADCLEDFFDLLLNELKKPENLLLNSDKHLFDVLEGIIN